MSQLPRLTKESVQRLDSKLQCSICLAQYNEPKLLPCFHIFCQSPCLEKLVVEYQNRKTITCQTCQYVTTLPEEGVAGLQKDFMTEHLFEVRSALSKARAANCEKCKKQQATGYCCECGNFICQSCSDTHKMWDELSGHKIVVKSEVDADTMGLAPSKQAPRCEKHPNKKLKIYCNSCSKLICTVCSINFHEGHSFELLESACLKHKEEIVSSLEPIKGKLETIKEALVAFEDRRKEIKEQKVTLEADINKEIERLQISLEQRREQLLHNLESRTQSKLEELALHKESVETLRVQMSRCTEYAESRIETGTESEVIGLKDVVVGRVEEVMKKYDQLTIQPQTKADTKLILDGKEKFLQTCKGVELVVKEQEDGHKKTAKPKPALKSKPTGLKPESQASSSSKAGSQSSLNSKTGSQASLTSKAGSQSQSSLTSKAGSQSSLSSKAGFQSQASLTSSAGSQASLAFKAGLASNHSKLLKAATKSLSRDTLPSSGTLQKAQTALMEKLQNPKAIQLHMASRKKHAISNVKEVGSLLEYLQGEGATLQLPMLIEIASQIADIMTCVEEQGYIHRDLAIRNIVIGQDLLGVIGNFTHITEGGAYEAPISEKFAVKWTAPEAMFQGRFTIKSDVWSFGIVLYELTTYGRFPYPGLTNNQVIDGLKEGYRMQKPVTCPDKLFEIMTSCWHEDPGDRPTFEALHWQLEEYFDADDYEPMTPGSHIPRTHS